METHAMARGLRSRFGRPLQSLAYATGAMQFSARMRGGDGGAIILMYHSVAEGAARPFIDLRNHVPADVFEQQMEFVAAHRRVVSLTELVEALRRNESPGSNTVAITFDDGYRDNLTTAAPVLSRLNLPATLFLPTGYIDRAEPQWVDQAYTAFEHRTADRLDWPGDGREQRFDLRDEAQSRQAYRVVCDALLTADHASRGSLLKALCEQLRPDAQPPTLTMSWDDVRTLVDQHPGFEIGGHTAGHVAMTSVDDDDARRELRQCMDRIDSQLGAKPRHFSFPYGRTSAQRRQLVADVGFESACGGGGGDAVVRSDTDRYALPRVAAPATMRRFDVLTSPANTGLWRRLGR